MNTSPDKICVLERNSTLWFNEPWTHHPHCKHDGVLCSNIFQQKTLPSRRWSKTGSEPFRRNWTLRSFLGFYLHAGILAFTAQELMLSPLFSDRNFLIVLSFQVRIWSFLAWINTICCLNLYWEQDDSRWALDLHGNSDNAIFQTSTFLGDLIFNRLYWSLFWLEKFWSVWKILLWKYLFSK